MSKVYTELRYIIKDSFPVPLSFLFVCCIVAARPAAERRRAAVMMIQRRESGEREKENFNLSEEREREIKSRDN